jgi:ArsR family transcriptional regulator
MHEHTFMCLGDGMTSEGPAECSTPVGAVDLQTAGRLAETFRVLGDATRVRIIASLRQGELCVGELALQLDMHQSAISHQLRVLRNLRLVRVRREGRQAYYALDDEHVLSLFAQGLQHVMHT